MNRAKSDKWQLLAVVVLALAAFGAQHVFHFKGSVPYFSQVSGGGELFDVVPSGSMTELYQRLADFGAAGRSEYVFRNKTTDVLLPLLLLLALVMGTERLCRRFSLGAWQNVVAALPYAYVTSDLAENLTVVSLIRHYPEKLATLATLLPILTWLKQLTFSASLLVLVGGATVILVDRLRSRAPS